MQQGGGKLKMKLFFEGETTEAISFVVRQLPNRVTTVG